MEGGNLRRLLRARAFCPPEIAFSALQQAAAGLDFAHASGFLHGDIKPENILVSASNHVCLADFGVSRHFDVQDRVVISRSQIGDDNQYPAGTSAYLSPEQLERNETGPSSDLYAFALVAFELLTGRLPFDIRAPLYKQLQARVSGSLLDARATNPQLPTHIATALSDALQPDKALRPPSASALMRRLRGEQEWDVFIAHAGGDIAPAERLFSLLDMRLRVFLDTKRLKYGDAWDLELARAQRNSLISVVLVSSKTDGAYYEREEVASAIKLSRDNPGSHRVVPLYLDSTAANRPPYGLAIRHGLQVGDDTSWQSVADSIVTLVVTARS